MKKTVIGILAHVDSGKTTLSEALLYAAGEIRKAGRVDHRDSFLDNGMLERERGITIFSKQAVIEHNDTYISLLDTPGHVDFSAEAERTLSVLDCAILVISGPESVQSHTETLWRLLEHHDIPVFIFINKMDLTTDSHEKLLSDLSRYFGDGFVDFTDFDADSAAVCSEDLLDEFLATGSVSDEKLTAAIAGRRLFPCYFGSALRLTGTAEFLAGLSRFAIPAPDRSRDEFGARIFKIARDPQNRRLTYMKITSGRLAVRTQLDAGKVSGIRIYSGPKFRETDCAECGMICAVTGLEGTRAGTGIGKEKDSCVSLIDPVMTYKAELAPDQDPFRILGFLRILEEEIPELNIDWNEDLREINLQIMGTVQLEIVKRLMHDRFGTDISFGHGNILYKEKIAGVAEGVGHFDPLRHYAEVHLLMEPGERGSGIVISADCSTDVLDINWQRLIMTHLAEKTHAGTLTGSPLTDTRITLVTGRASEVHTEGGDFRQATYRAVRQGLMEAGCVLLEPWYDFTITVPSENVGRVISDVQRMGGRTDSQETGGDFSVITGGAPVSTIMDYAVEVSVFTRGRGRVSTTNGGYDVCHNAVEVVAAYGYDPERDILNPPDSVFCLGGSSTIVKWDKVKEYMNVESVLDLRPDAGMQPAPVPVRASAHDLSSDAERRHLDAIFEKTYGPVRDRHYRGPVFNSADGETPQRRRLYRGTEDPAAENYLIIDGYNLIYSWDELRTLMESDFSSARTALIDRLANYRSYVGVKMMVVFDAYKVKGGQGSVERIHGIDVIYTKEAQTADSYIEKVTYEISRRYRVRVVTSDGMEQLIILGNGALRVSSRAFIDEVRQVEEEIRGIIGT